MSNTEFYLGRPLDQDQYDNEDTPDRSDVADFNQELFQAMQGIEDESDIEPNLAARFPFLLVSKHVNEARNQVGQLLEVHQIKSGFCLATRKRGKSDGSLKFNNRFYEVTPESFTETKETTMAGIDEESHVVEVLMLKPYGVEPSTGKVVKIISAEAA